MAEPSVKAIMDALVYRVKNNVYLLLDPTDEEEAERLKDMHRVPAGSTRKPASARKTQTGIGNAKPKRTVRKQVDTSDDSATLSTDDDDATDASEDDFELDDDNDDMADNSDSLDDDEEDEDGEARICHAGGKRTRQERQRSHTDSAKPPYKDWLNYQLQEGSRTYQDKIDFAERDIMGYLMQRQEGLKHCADIALNFERMNLEEVTVLPSAAIHPIDDEDPDWELTDDSQAEECEEWEDWELEVLALMTPVDLSKPIPKDRLEMVIDIEVKRQMGGWANVKRDPRWNDPYANYPMTPQAVDEYFTNLAPGPIPVFDLLTTPPMLFTDLDGCVAADLTMDMATAEEPRADDAGADEDDSEYTDEDGSEYTDDDGWEEWDPAEVPLNPITHPSPRMVLTMAEGPEAIAKVLAQQKALRAKRTAQASSKAPTELIPDVVKQATPASAASNAVEEADLDAPVIWKRGFPCMTDADDDVENPGPWQGFDDVPGESLFTTDEEEGEDADADDGDLDW